MNKLLKLLLFLLVFSACAPPLSAQIGLNIEINNKNFLQYEQIYVRVTFRNFTGHPLIFSENPKLGGKLTFEIEGAKTGFAPARQGQPPLVGLILRPGATEKIVFEITQFYEITDKDRYHLKAFLEHAQMPRKYESNSQSFSVVDGVTVWERIIGVPSMLLSDNKDMIKTRTARIVSFYDGKDKIFYLVIEDPKTIYLVRRIGYDIGASKPKCEIDGMSRIHIILQAGPKLFAYFVYDLNGHLDTKEQYHKTDYSPVLVRDPKTGSVVVVGGERAIKDVHYKEDGSGTLFKENDTTVKGNEPAVKEPQAGPGAAAPQ